MKYLKFIILAIIVLIPCTANAQEKEKIFSQEYYYEGENPIEYPYKSDISKKKVSEEIYDTKEEKPNRTFEEVNTYEYQGLGKVDRINIRQTSSSDFNIKNVRVFYEDEEISYSYICSDCYSYALGTFEKEFIYNQDKTIENNAKVELILQEEYDPSKLRVELEISKTNDLSRIQVVFYQYKRENRYMIKGTISPSSEYIYFDINTLENDIEKLTLKKENIIKPFYEEETFKSDEKLDKDFYKEVSVSTKYRYIDQLYLYYKLIDKEDDKEEIKIPIETPKPKKEPKQQIVKTVEESPITYVSNEEIVFDTSDPKPIKEDTKEPIKKQEQVLQVQTLSNKKVSNESKIYKFQHLLIAIILIILVVMGVYAIYRLKKEWEIC